MSAPNEPVLNVAAVRPGHAVAVFGCGGVGLSAIMAARTCRASPIIAVDVLESRLRMARELGATETIDASGTNAVEAIQTLTGVGVDYAFECIGRADAIRQAVDATRPGGSAVISGRPPGLAHPAGQDTLTLEKTGHPCFATAFVRRASRSDHVRLRAAGSFDRRVT